MMSSIEHPEVFISYSSKDEDQRKHLEEHLAVLHHQDKLSFWSDEQLQLNDDWRSVINENLENCKIAVLLISRHFLASNFIMKEEMPIFFERRKRGELKIFMLMLSPCNWQEVPWTEGIQGFPIKNSPLSGMKKHKKNEELVAFVTKISDELKISPKNNTTGQFDAPKSPFNIPFESKGEGAIGLEEKLQEVDNALNDTKSHRANIGQVASFQGMGGLGKTQLAVEYAHRYREDYDGVVWLTVDQDIDRQIIELAESMGWVAKEVDAKIKLDIAKSKYASLENTLLVYDNVENYTTEVEPLIPKANNNKILLTSRSAIRGFTTVELLTLDDENAIKLLKYESKREINPEDNTWVEKIVQALDGLPLALEMVGAYMLESELSWQEYWELFDAQSVVLLERSDIPGSGTNHENNISKTLSIGQSILDKTPLLTAIIQLLAFGSSEPMDKLLLSKMLDVTQAEIADAISYGVKLRFVKKEEEEGKPLYTLHRLVREVWRAQHTVEDDFTQRVSKALADYLREIKDEFLNLSQLETGAFQSIVWADRVKENALSALLVNYAAYPHYHLGHFKKALTLVENAHAKIDKSHDTQAYAEILNSMGSVLHSLGDAKSAKPYYLKALEMWQRLYTGDHPDVANSLNNMGSVLNALGDAKGAKPYLLEVLEMTQRLYMGDHPNVASSLNNMGFVLDALGDAKGAKPYFLEALEMTQRLYMGDHPDVASSLYNVGALLLKLKQCFQAKSYLLDAKDMKIRLGFDGDNIVKRIDNMLKMAEKNIEKEKKLNFKKKGRYCVDEEIK